MISAVKPYIVSIDTSAVLFDSIDFNSTVMSNSTGESLTTSNLFDSFSFNFEVIFLYFLLLISVSSIRSVLVYYAN